jgi:hypothetical protein
MCSPYLYICPVCVHYENNRYRKLLVDCAEWSVHGSNDNTSSNSDGHKQNNEQTSATQQQVTAAASIALQLSNTLQSLYTVTKHSSDDVNTQASNEDTTAAVTETTSLTKATMEQVAVQYRADALYTHTDAIAEVRTICYIILTFVYVADTAKSLAIC